MKFSVTLPRHGIFEAWRAAARLAISHRIPPEEMAWSGTAGLFGGTPLPERSGAHAARVRPGFIGLARRVVWHAEPERFGLLYRALWRLDGGDGAALSPADPLGRRLGLMAKAVGRDIHKMHAFVRFRELRAPGERRSFGAWFEPDHHTLEPGSAFFVRRFADMDWMIATPTLSARYEGGELSFAEGGRRPDLPEDASAALWATYFTHIFNPARIKLEAMRAEMPRKYWKNLPETDLVPSMLAGAEARVQRMREAGAGTPRKGAGRISDRYRETLPVATDLPATLDEARDAAMQCRRCPLFEPATQTVWGEGDPKARIMIVGEQPGDREDLAGRPFVGPAGQVLREVMEEAGLDPRTVWLTNAVKHFKFTTRGKRRLHQKPNPGEVAHCRWWLGLELALMRPRIVMALGATAASALTGSGGPLARRRGAVEAGVHGGPVLISWHPSHILRTPDRERQELLRRDLVADVAAARARAATADGGALPGGAGT